MADYDKGTSQFKGTSGSSFKPLTVDEGINRAATMATSAVKFDGDKLRWDLLPVGPLEEVVEIWTFGAKKYADHNWRKGFKYSRPLAAAMRHLFAWAAGIDLDIETKRSHLAHCICCLMMLIEFQNTKTGEDDRYKRE